MIKFKDLIIYCDSEEQALEELVAIERYCNKGNFRYDEEMEQMYEQNDKLAHILCTLPNTPQALVLVYSSRCTLSVLNIVPFKHSTTQLTHDEYNRIVDAFLAEVVLPLFDGKHKVFVSPAEISIKDTIPKSYIFLESWVTCPGAPNNPFSHPNDLHRWFDFICALHTNREELSSGDLEQWLMDDNGWDEDVVTDTIIRYETERDLLNYYDSHYGRN